VLNIFAALKYRTLIAIHLLCTSQEGFVMRRKLPPYLLLLVYTFLPMPFSHESPFEYIKNLVGNSASMIDTATNAMVGDDCPWGGCPLWEQ
jgi:hypothetical protein